VCVPLPLTAYLSFDIDALDPAYAPGTGTPEVGGFSTHFAQQLLRGLGTHASAGTSAVPRGGVNLVGADLVEVSPPYDAADITSLAGANLIFEMLCVMAEAKARRG
jgi:guanidinopropionase